MRSGLGLDWLPGTALVGGLLTAHYRSMHDLAEGSEGLRQLEDDSRAARDARSHGSQPPGAAPGAVRYLRARICHAAGDKVVVQDRFDDDWRPSDTVVRRNHRTICKPDPSYRNPVQALEALLAEAGQPV